MNFNKNMAKSYLDKPWTLTKKDTGTLAVFERKILRIILNYFIYLKLNYIEFIKIKI